MSKMKAITLFIQLLMLIMVMSVPFSVEAQSTVTGNGGFRRNVATVIFCGIGGAVLGISTLSFYGDPQNHISNITSGLALGLLGGAGYVVMQASDTGHNQTQLTEPLREMILKNHNPKPALAWSWVF